MMEMLLAEEDDESRRLAKKKEKRKEKKKKRKSATKQKQAERGSSEKSLGSNSRSAPLRSASSTSKTLSVSERSFSHSSTDSQDGERDNNRSDLDSDEENCSDPGAHHCTQHCDDPCSFKQLSLDEEMERKLLSSMGWIGSSGSGASFPELDVDTDDEHHGIPESEIEFWKRNRSTLVSKRLAQRQKLQERFDQFVLRSNSLAET
ncbi:hypothetical protein PINS_up001784 [Pythium insidiosum]|nr:hypothetical protein PINS_up001784 [Pythium insidiosum]